MRRRLVNIHTGEHVEIIGAGTTLDGHTRVMTTGGLDGLPSEVGWDPDELKRHYVRIEDFRPEMVERKSIPIAVWLPETEGIESSKLALDRHCGDGTCFVALMHPNGEEMAAGWLTPAGALEVIRELSAWLAAEATSGALREAA